MQFLLLLRLAVLKAVTLDCVVVVYTAFATTRPVKVFHPPLGCTNSPPCTSRMLSALRNQGPSPQTSGWDMESSAYPYILCMALPYTMNLANQTPRIDYSIEIKLEPVPETSQKIAFSREWLTQQTGLPTPTSMAFHITLAYLLRTLTDQEREELTALVQGNTAEASHEVVFPVVDLCSFENMQGFRWQYVFLGM
jgi:hypothetical protein